MLTTLLSLDLYYQLATNQTQRPSTPTNKTNVQENLPANPYPINKSTKVAPQLQAKAALSLDLETGQILYQKNANQRLPMASLTKLMTAQIILSEHDLNQTVTIAEEATRVEPAKLWLRANEQISIQSLLQAILIKSANDAAIALAIENSGSVESFVAKMNQQAQQYGMHNTSFQNPVGFDHPDQFSTAHDLAILTRLAYQNPFIKQTAKIKSLEISSQNQQFTYQLENTNQLLNSYLTVLGLKTGTTDLAGQCLITIVTKDNHTIANIILNSPDRFQESKILSEWIFQSYNWT